MADKWMIKAIDAAFKDLLGDLSSAGLDVRVQLIGTGYTFNAAHEFMSDVGANKVGTAVALASKSFANGTFDAASPVAYGGTSAISQGAYIYIYTGSDATSRLILWLDGKQTVTLAAPALISATTLYVEPLSYQIPNGTTFTIGGVSVTTTALAAADARQISVSATSGPIALGSTGEASKGQGFPIPANPGGIDLTLAGAPNEIARLVV